MLEAIIVSFVCGFVIGGCFGVAVLAFMMGASEPDGPEKRQMDWEALQECEARRRDRRRVKERPCTLKPDFHPPPQRRDRNM